MPAHKTTTQLMLLLLAIVIFLLCGTAATVLAAFEPTVVFLHRHGARSPQGIVTQDGKQVANCEYPLCQLTDAGKAQCFSLGKYLRTNFLDKYAPAAVKDGYDVKQYHTESTDTRRTVQSSEGVLAGVFGKAMTPFVNFVPTTLDYNMSFWSSWPYWRLGQVRKTRLYSYPGQYIKEHFTDVPGDDGGDIIAKFGKILGAEQLCERSPVDCVILVADILECNTTNGDPLPPLFTKHATRIRTAKAVMFAKLLGYDDSDRENSVQPGGWGYNLAVELLESLAYDTGSNKDNNDAAWPYRVFHYSAHDWTLFPLYSAFGFWLPSMLEDTEWIPRFADTLVFVTTEPTTTGGERGVKCYRVYPDQVPKAGKDIQSADAFPVSGHSEVGLLCSSGGDASTSNNKKKFSNESAYGCSISELYKTVERVAPQANPGGKCFTTRKHMQEAGCLSDAAPKEGSSCMEYRAVCNTLPCGQAPEEGVNFDTVSGFTKLSDPERGYACTETDPTKQGPYPTGEAVALVVSGFVFGGLVGVVLAWRYFASVKSHFEDTPAK